MTGDGTAAARPAGAAAETAAHTAMAGGAADRDGLAADRALADPAAGVGAGPRSKLVATWVALVGGSLGLHRFYLHGRRDRGGWLFPLPTLVGLYGVLRMRALGVDDRLAWLLIPLLGATLAVSMLSAIVYGLTPDETWNRRFNRASGDAPAAGWGTVAGVIVALAVGAAILMATLAFSAQRYFEYQELRQPAP